MKRILQMFLVLSGACGALAQGTFVVPYGQATVEGNSGTSDPFTSPTFRFQQVFDASQFVGLGNAFVITSISFRIDGASSGDVLYSFGGSTIQLSTTLYGPDSLRPVFADNIGNDVTTIRNGAISFGGLLEPGANPQPFGQTITATTLFTYDPSQGNLLLDIVGAGGLTLFPGSLDAQAVTGDGISWVFSVNGNSPSGTPNTLGLVTRFGIAVVPEPSTVTLALLAVAAVFLGRIRRKSE